MLGGRCLGSISTITKLPSYCAHFQSYPLSVLNTPSNRSFHSSPVCHSAHAKSSHYEVLGVHKTASDDDIKKAYLKKAREFHPDLNQHDPAGAQQKFVEISSAYEVLKDSTKRSIYDYEFRHTTYSAGDYAAGDFSRPRASPGYSYSGNPRRKNTMWVDEDIEVEDDDESFMDAAEFSRVFQSMFTNNSFKRPNRQSSNNPFANFESIFTFGGGPAARKRMRDDFAGWYEIVFPEGPGRYRQKQHKSPKKAGNSGKGKEEADDFKSKRTKQKMQAQEFVRKMKEEATKPKKKKESDRSYESSKQSKKGRKQESHREAQGYNNKKSFSSSTRHRRGGRDGY